MHDGPPIGGTLELPFTRLANPSPVRLLLVEQGSLFFHPRVIDRGKKGQYGCPHDVRMFHGAISDLQSARKLRPWLFDVPAPLKLLAAMRPESPTLRPSSIIHPIAAPGTPIITSFYLPVPSLLLIGEAISESYPTLTHTGADFSGVPERRQREMFYSSTQ